MSVPRPSRARAIELLVLFILGDGVIASCDPGALMCDGGACRGSFSCDAYGADTCPASKGCAPHPDCRCLGASCGDAAAQACSELKTEEACVGAGATCNTEFPLVVCRGSSACAWVTVCATERQVHCDALASESACQQAGCTWERNCD
jgi:hypothetical protein